MTLGKKYKFPIIIIGTILFVGSLYFHSIENYSIYRLLRGITCFTFLAFLFVYLNKKISTHIASFLFLCGLSSVCTVWYENNLMATLSMLLNFLAYLALIFFLVPKVNFKKMNFLLTTLFTILVLFLGYLLYELLQMVREMTLSNAHYILMLISTISVVVLGFLTLLFNHKYSSKDSLNFTLFVFVLFFSEVFRAIAYYNIAFGNIAVYVGRALFIISLYILVEYTFLRKSSLT